MLLSKTFLSRDTATIARKLLGTVLIHESPEGATAGRIVETEAYLRDDAACHASRGKTARNAAMFGPPGCAYIYFIYGMYYCFNVVTAKEGVGEAVLIRALEPLEGIEVMKKRRGTHELKNLCSGPGKLVLAMGITRALNGHDLRTPPLTIDVPGRGVADSDIVTTRRIGITAAAHLPLRFYIKGSHFASRRCRFSGKK